MAERGAGIGIVAIGRNEGARLERCLHSLTGVPGPVVYVDSASTDGSPETAAALGAEVHRLDPARPFTAARARAEGFARLVALAPDLAYVMFVDGDCEVEAGWLDTAREFLEINRRHAAVCGRRRERFPAQSLYNQAMDLEWDAPVGDVDACGGDAVFRIEAYREAGGYDPEMVAHEEPELCSRIRKHGWSVARVAAPMTVHDANILRLRPYLKRGVRSGYGYAQALGRMDRRFAANEIQLIRRALQWPALLLASLALGLVWPWLALLGPGLLTVSFPRDLRRHSRQADAWKLAGLRILIKFAEFIGIMRRLLDVLRQRGAGAILYK